jgi:hypothetical protein
LLQRKSRSPVNLATTAGVGTLRIARCFVKSPRFWRPDLVWS